MLKVLISIIITYFGYITRKMESNLNVTKADFENRASIITAIVLDFNFINKAHNFSGKDISDLVHEGAATSLYADDVQSALNTKSIRDVLTIFYNATFTSHKDGGNNSTLPEQNSHRVWKIRNSNGGVFLPNLIYEFPYAEKGVLIVYSREQRFKALFSRLMSKFILTSSTPTALGNMILKMLRE
jgi:hypothetical protein